MRLAVLGMLVVINVVIFTFPTPNGLSVSFFDVGQGDAIFIEGPRGAQVLIDGGSTRAILRRLNERLPFFDRTLDAVIATHPDQDHIGGLVDVAQRYSVGVWFDPGVESDTAVYRALQKAHQEKQQNMYHVSAPLRIALGGGAYADLLFPNQPLKTSSSNASSIVVRVVYGDHAVLLTGDAPASIERYLIALYGGTLKSTVLKVGHHGSHTSSEPAFVRTVNPQHVVYSRGCDNRYGHPHEEVVNTFTVQNAQAHDTCTHGTVRFTFSEKGVRVTRAHQ